MTSNEEEKSSSVTKVSKSTTSYTRTKDPRIVCVSRAFGGKDRHSKVCTVRGLRDRRVRLSVPTAIQLYDLQDRLGLNQPSKVVDWLLDAAKSEIDELPPLQMPQGNFGQSSTSNIYELISNPPQFDKEGIKNNTTINWEDHMREHRPNYWNTSMNLRGGKSKEVEKESEHHHLDHQGNNVAYNIPSSNVFSRNNPPMLNNEMQNNSSFLRWDPSSNLSLSNFGHESGSSHHDHGFNGTPLMPYFPCGAGEFDPNKQFNFQMLGSSSSNNTQNPHQLSVTSVTPPIYHIGQGMRSFDLSINPNLFPCHNESGSKPHEK